MPTKPLSDLPRRLNLLEVELRLLAHEALFGVLITLLEERLPHLRRVLAIHIKALRTEAGDGFPSILDPRERVEAVRTYRRCLSEALDVIDGARKRE